MLDTTFLISGGFFDAVDSDRLYSADQMNQPYKKIISDGLFFEGGDGGNIFKATAGGGMKVNIGPGNAMIGGKWAENKDALAVEVSGNTSGSARIDSIILQCDKSREVRAVQIVYRQGTTTAPDLVNSDDITELRLANILVPSAASAIASENITDTRGGAECPWVTSIISPSAEQIENGVGQYLNDNPGALSPAIEESVAEWLEEHPEETLAIPDNSITVKKLVTGTLGYVTPEMYGAKADGATDDSDAIQAAVNSGHPVMFDGKTYLITKTIHLYNLRLFELDASAATIVYTGLSYAFDIRALRYSVLRFGSIIADDGGCLYFDGGAYAYWSQYVNIYFELFQAAETMPCVYAYGAATWINEIRWHNGRLTSGLYGFRIVRESADHNITHWNFHNVGVEGVTTGFSLESANDNSGKGIGSFVFEGCRVEESYTTLISSSGKVYRLVFYLGQKFPTNKVITDSNATMWYVYGAGGGTLELINGQWVSEPAHYALSGGLLLSQNTDLNNVTEFGNYYCNTNALAASMTNCPTDKAFSLTVEQRAGEYYRWQILHTYTGITYERSVTSYDNGQTWSYGDWISDEWINVSNAITYNSEKVTSGTLSLLYNAKYRMAVLSGNVAVALSAGDNVIGTISTDYDAAAYYVALNVSWDDVFPSRIKNHTQINIHPSASYTGNIAVSGIWKV